MKENLNYKIMLTNHTDRVKNAWNNYKNLYIRYLNSAFINDDGSYCFSKSLLEKTNKACDEYIKANHDLVIFKNTYAEELRNLKNVTNNETHNLI